MMDRGQGMLGLIQEVYEDGKDLIRNWQLMNQATERLQKDGVVGLKRYYEEYLSLPKGRMIKDTLERNRRKTLESQRRRFMVIYNSQSD